MFDRHTAHALMKMGRMSSHQFLRVFGDNVRKGRDEVRKRHRKALDRLKGRTPKTAEGKQTPTYQANPDR